MSRGIIKMANTTVNWEKDWVLTYDLDHAEGITKDDIVNASDKIFKKSFSVDKNSYELPSTTLWASRDKFADINAVKEAFVSAFKVASKNTTARIKRLVICDYAKDKLYVENN